MRSRQLVFGLLFVGGALLCGAVALYSSIKAANRVRGLSPVTVAVLEHAQLGKEVLVEGCVSDRNPVLSEPTGFVAYVHEWREVTYDGEGRPDPGNWSVGEQVTPPLLLELSDGLVQIDNDDYDIENPHVVDKREPGQSVDEVDTRYRGIRRGDPAIAVGIVSAGVERPQVRADFVARGTRASYLARQRWGGRIFCAFSIAVAVLGGAIVFWDRVGRLLSRWRSPRQRDWKGARSGEDGENDR